jgi:hypothetical protein
MDDNPYQSPHAGQEPPAPKPFEVRPRRVGAVTGFLFGVLLLVAYVSLPSVRPSSPVSPFAFLTVVIPTLIGWFLGSLRR